VEIRSFAVAASAALLLAGCSTETLDPAPPLDRKGHTGSDNALLDDPPLSCADRRNAAERHVLDELAHGVAGCRSDDECTIVQPHTECRRTCPVVVAAYSTTRVELAATEADERWCSRFASECSSEVGKPSGPCDTPVPRCVGRRCVDGAAE
jgi:hypothetical protein